MSTPIENRDLTIEAPHSPYDRYGDFAIIGRTIDKCRASIAGKLGEYHYDCPLDNMLFSFKGINGAEFKKVVSSARTYEDVADWLQSAGTRKSPDEIEDWSQHVEEIRLRDLPSAQDPEHRREFQESCDKLGLDFGTVTLFDWLDADDEATFEEADEEHEHPAHH